MSVSGRLKIEDKIADITQKAVRQAVNKGLLSLQEIPKVQVEVPREEKFGDFSVNTAMQLAKAARTNPRAIAQLLIDEMALDNTLFETPQIAGAGFINFTCKPVYLEREIQQVLTDGADYGRIVRNDGATVNVEFVSANPTGPLHIGNARGGAVGDVLANLLSWAGYRTTKEFYLNDAGNQIEKFGQSLSARYLQALGEAVPFPEDGYQGEDIKALAQRYLQEEGARLKDVPAREREITLREYALKINSDIMFEDLQAYGINYDVWFKESTLHQGAVQEAIDLLGEKGATYEKKGSFRFKASQYGCEKDEVLVRNNGIPTYYAADIAYHFNKLRERKFTTAINIWGADHHGHVQRLKSAMAAADINPDRLQVVLMQLVHLVKGKESVRLSKRKGEIVTLNDLLEDVGVDAARFIFNYSSPSTHMEFDLDLAVKQSNENPVFYVQYAHARICSILRNIGQAASNSNLALLKEKEERNLMKKISEFSYEISQAAKDYDPSRMTRYAVDLSAAFHSFYNACRVKNEDKALMNARLCLVQAALQTLKNVISIIGISAPEQM